MKVGFISNHSFLRPGGVKSHILALSEQFQKLGIKTKIIIPRKKKSEKYNKDIIFLGRAIPIDFNGTEADFSFALNYKKIKKILEKEKFDVLHFHNFGLLSWQILRKSKSLNIVTVHTGYSKKEIENPFSKIKFQRKREKILGLLSILFSLENNFFSFIVKKVKKKVDGLIFTSKVAEKSAMTFGPFSMPKKIIPNGVDIKRFSKKETKIERFSNDNYLNILYLGRIEERKGLIYLLKAFKILKNKFNNLRLIIVGDGSLRKKAEKFTREQKLENVFFEGQVSNDMVPRYFQTADIFVSPAFFGESFGIVLLEAMASGCPVVAFSNEGYKTVMEGEYKKFLAKNKDYIDLAKKIEIFIKSKKERERMKKFGLRLVKKYSWEKIAKDVLNFYKFCQHKKIR